MPGLNVNTGPIVSREKPYPTSVGALAAKIKSSDPDVAQALLLLQKHCEDLSRAVRQNSPAVRQVVATDRAGNMVAQIGELPTKDGRILYGLQGVTLYVGDVLGDGDPTDAPVYADNSGVHVGKSGWLDVLDPYNAVAAWLGAQFDTLAVTGAANNGSGEIRLTVAGHTLSTGDKPRVLHVGGVPNATGIFTVTNVDPSHIDLQNSVWDGAYTAGGTVDRLLHVTGAVNNGSGLIRLTLPGHGYETADRATVANIGGVPNATGQWMVTAVDANHIDLQGSTWGGGYIAGGICLRYFAGGNFQNIAIGPSFQNYKLRAFPDGTLKILNALISLLGTAATITLDPNAGTITVAAKAPATLVTLIDEGGVTLYSTAGAQPGVFIANGSIALNDNVTAAGGLYTLAGNECDVLPDQIALKNAAGNAVVWLDLTNGVRVYSGGALAVTLSAADGSVNALKYKANGVSGISATRSFLTSVSISTGSFVTSVNFLAQTYTTGIAVISVGQNTLSNTFSQGLLLA